MNGVLRDAARAMFHAKRPTVLTGAGVSAESGIPTYRGVGGFWKDEAEVLRLATLDGFRRDPRAVWEFYDNRRMQAFSVKPNPGHEAIAHYEFHATKHGRSFTLITQNVDGLHMRAGNKDILELHGSVWHARCYEECSPDLTLLPETPLPEYPPKCPRCGGMLRPHIVWFGEQLDPAVIAEAVSEAERSDLMLVAGTSSQVYPAAGLPYVTKRAGGTVVQINLEPTELSYAADYNIYGKSGEILPELMLLVEIGAKL
jgi:NAD-dependent SIR2 family protein deacetylase